MKATYYDLHTGTRGEEIWGAPEEAAAKNKPVAAPTATAAPKLKTLSGTYTSRARAMTAAKKAWKQLRKRPGDLAGVKAHYQDAINKVSGDVSYGRADDEKRHQSAAKLAARDAKKIDPATDPQTAIDHSADNLKTLRHVYASRENARRAARAEYLRLGRGAATFSITLANGRPELIPEVPAQVRGWKTEIDATDWIIIRVTHNLTDAGYTTRVEMEMRAVEAAG